jgi:primosomal protein N' (replication factor Y)
VALDVPLAKLFDYAAPDSGELAPGDRVTVQFGARQRLGVVVEAAAPSELPAERIKPIIALRDDAPRLPADWLELMRFLAGYYQRPYGETVIGALPPRLRSVRPLPRKLLNHGADGALPRFTPRHVLSDDQARAVDSVAASLGRFHAWLLHGVTGSGKTEVYLHLVAKVLERGGQALVLVPEISLTPQLEARFREAFGGTAAALLHSGLEDVARTSAWLAAARGEAGIVLGTRLAVLAPLPKLALIVVDEEHDSSFKQQEGLRYSARDVAVYRAKLAGCPVVLGTATPSLGTWHELAPAALHGAPRARRARRAGAKLRTVRTVDLRRSRAGTASPKRPRRRLASGSRARAEPRLHQPAGLCARAFLRGLRLGGELRPLHRAPRAACQGRACALATRCGAQEACRAPARPAATSTWKPMGRGTQRVGIAGAALSATRASCASIVTTRDGGERWRAR